MNEQYYTFEQAGQMLGVSARTVSRWARQHRPRIRPTTRKGDRHYLLSKSQIAKLAATHHIVLGVAQPANGEQVQQVENQASQKQGNHKLVLLALGLLSALLLWVGTLLQRWQSRRQQH